MLWQPPSSTTGNGHPTNRLCFLIHSAVVLYHHRIAVVCPAVPCCALPWLSLFSVAFLLPPLSLTESPSTFSALIMDALVNAVRKLPANPTADDMHSLTRRFADGDKTLKKSTAAIDDVLHSRLIDTTQHSYAATQLLVHRLDTDPQPSNKPSHTALLTYCHELFTTLAAPQLPYCLPELFVVAERYQRLAGQLGRPYAPLLSFYTALQTFHTVFPHSLTPLHCQFVKLATRGKQYRLALSLLESHAIYTVRERRDGVDALLYLEWCYYAAITFMVYQRWREAADYLHLALSLPGNAISKVQVAAYKKLLIVSLLAGGTEVLQLGARVTSQVVIRHMEPLVQPYIDLAKAYLHELNDTKTSLSNTTATAPSSTVSSTSTSTSSSSSSSSSTSASKSDSLNTAGVIASYIDDFHTDRNLGLVRQLATYLLHAQLQRLTSTYLTLPLSSLPTLLPTPSNSQPLLSHLTRLIASQRITGRIDKRADLVSFDEEGEEGEQDGLDEAGQSTVVEMGALIGQLLDMRAAVAERNRRLSLNALYIAKTLPSEKEGEGVGGVGGGGLGLVGGGDEGWGRGGGGGKRSSVRGGATLEEEQLNRVLAASMMEQ